MTRRKPPPEDPFAPNPDAETPDEFWADPAVSDTYIGEHWFAYRSWLPAGSRVGEHLTHRCCPHLDEPSAGEQLGLQEQVHGGAA